MKNLLSRALSLLCSLSLALSLTACGEEKVTSDGGQYDSATLIELSDDGITVSGEAAPTDGSAAVYTAHDIVYYESGHDFTYGAGSEADAHDAAEADAHTVVHITQPGTYLLTGKLSAGQIAVDLGKEAKTDPNAVVELVLDNADITCTVAPAIIFYRVYECDEAFVDFDENDTEGYEATWDVDTTAAGARVTLLAGTENTVNGSYVARIYKPESVELSEDGTEVTSQKKLHKYDGALYSKMSMNVGGEGSLTINAENEGLDSELHLTINSGSITINAGNDGINTNEDEISVTTVNGGSLTVNVTGETGEGDGIDSNGWLVINGGTVSAFACSTSGDSGIDSDMGIYINGGTVLATGNMYDRIDSSAQSCAVLQFAQRQSGGEVYTLKTDGGDTLAQLQTVNDFQYLVFSSPDLAAGDYTLWCGETQLGGVQTDSLGMGGMPMGEAPDGMELPDGFDPADMGAEPPEGFDPGTMGERPEKPEGMELPSDFAPRADAEIPEKPDEPVPFGADGAQQNDAPEKPDGELPEGFDPGTMGDGRRPDGMSGTGGADTSARSETFSLTDGVSFFTNVGALEA